MNELPLVLLLGCARLAPLLDEGVQVSTLDSVHAALVRARRLQPSICVLGGPLASDGVGHRVRSLRRALPFTDVLVWSPQIPAPLVREALRAGAVDVLLEEPEVAVTSIHKVLDEQKLLPRVLERQDQDDHTTWRFEGLMSRSRTMWDLFETCARTAPTEASVLILGETGTGKELLARAIHRRSGREGAFVGLNCGAVPESLMDSVLFGHVEGAFTGAEQDQEGLFRHADGGTLFLDEIGNLPLTGQHRLLRVLQESVVRPVGGQEVIPVDVRIVAATSTSLASAVETEVFREDLLYRIDVIRLIVPPLRKRPEDILFLFGYFARQLAEHYSVQRPELSEGFLDALLAWAWPGNVRELENFTERLLLTQSDPKLAASHFTALMRDFETPELEAEVTSGQVAPELASMGVSLDQPLSQVVADTHEQVERAYLTAALRQSRGRIQQAADQAGISRRTLARKLARYGIDKRDYR